MERQMIRKIMDREVALKGFVTAIDVLNGLHILAPSKYQRWKRGELSCLEKACKASFYSLTEILHEMQEYAKMQRLIASWSCYPTIRGEKLQFTKRGIPYLETLYATHYVDLDLAIKMKRRQY